MMLAGARSGKTALGPVWLYREMQRRGPGDYLVAAPSYKLIDKAAAPELEHTFGRILKLGTLIKSPFEFRISADGEAKLFGGPQERPSRILFGHADDPDSLEAMTAKAAWADEVGQRRFRLDSWQAIQRRLSVDEGRVLMTTTPYGVGWLKNQIYDPWIASGRNHAEIDVFSFPSTANPAFPPEELERARRDLPPWKFRMFYLGEFDRPAGMIYDVFESRHKRPAFVPPGSWQRYLGLDFGGVNTVGVFLARDPTSSNDSPRFVAYREYHAGGRTAKQHVEHLLKNEPPNIIAFGGAGSEGQWRDEFNAAGLKVHEPPIKEVEVGINRVYSMFANDRLQVCDNLAGLLDDLGTYSRELGPDDQPTEKIEDKETFHYADAARYICAYLAQPQKPKRVIPSRPTYSMRRV